MGGETKILFILLIALACLSKHTIEDIKQALKNEMNYFQGRTAQGEAAYQTFRQKLKEQQRSLPEFIKNEKFGFDGEAQKPIFQLVTVSFEGNQYRSYVLTDDVGNFPWVQQQLSAQQSISSLSINETFLLLTMNDFPYDIEDHVQHCLVWSNFQIDLKLVQRFLDSVIVQGYKYFAYINPVNRKSIPEIFHAQIFVYEQPIDGVQL